MKNTQKGFIVPLLIAIVAVLALGGGYYYYSSNVYSSAYSDSNFGVTFQIPAGWVKVNYGSGMGNTIGYSYIDKTKQNVIFKINKTLDNGRPLGSTNLAYNNPAYDKLGVVQGDTTFAGLPAYKIFTGGVSQGQDGKGGLTGNNISLKFENWYVKNNGSVYEVTLQSTADYYNSNQDLINTLINSVKFI